MATPKAVVRFTANFEANLAAIAEYWAERDAPHAYGSLLDDLGANVIAVLERHPRIGRNFFARAAQSIEARERVATLRKRFGAVEVREYLAGDYLVLYRIDVEGGVGEAAGSVIHLLAIRHHLPLSFDFDGFWQARSRDE